MYTKTNLHVLTIEHMHGVSVFVFTSREKVQACLEKWVKHWWESELKVSRPEALTGEDLVEEYFDKMRGSESYDIAVCELNQSYPLSDMEI